MGPPSKRRKTGGVEEVSFDFSAREEYLTGFHKRKLQRAKHAQQEAVKKDREFRIEQRKQLREQRKQDLETHVETVNTLLRKAAEGSSDEETDAGLGEQDEDAKEATDVVTVGKDLDTAREEEYIDEDKYTTVTVEPMNLSGSEDDAASDDDAAAPEDAEDKSKTTATSKKTRQSNIGKDGKRIWTKEKPDTGKAKKKRKKFRYESKIERKLNRTKLAVKNSAAAKARRGE